MKEDIIRRLKEQKGRVGFYCKNLVTGQVMEYKSEEQYLAASVIKLPVFMSISKWDSEGKASMSDKVQVRNKDKEPICGALTLFTDEPVVDVRTLCNLMISISDNTATNLLIKKYGILELSSEFLKIGLKDTELNRILFDPDKSHAGMENYIVPSEMAMLLEKVYRGTFVSKKVSKDIEDTLLLQQINHKIGGIINDEVPVAHKTGEDDGVTNDVGIVYAKEPFVICFAGTDTDVPEFEDLIRHVSYEVFKEYNK